MSKKEYKYHSYMTWDYDGQQMSLVTQMYSVGLYIVLNRNGRMLEQHGIDPKDMPDSQARHIESLKADPKVKDIVLGTEMIAFENADGYWESRPVEEKTDVEKETVN